MLSYLPRLVACGLAALLVSAIAPHQAAAQSTPTTVTMTISSDGLYYLLQYVAQGAGLFKKEGIDIDLVEVQSGSRQVASVMGGSALATPVNIEGAIQSSQQGGNLVAVAALYDVYPMALVVSNAAAQKAGITPAMSVDDKIKRLRGLKISITSPGSGTDNFVRTLFTSRGIDPDKEVTLVPLGGVGPTQYAAFERGAVDAAAWSSPLPELAEKQGIGTTIVDPFSGQKIEYDVEPYIVLTVSRETLNTKRKELIAMLRAYAEAINLIKSNPAEARRVVRAKFKDADDAVFNAGFEKYLSSIPKTLVITPQQFETTLAAMRARRTTPLDVKYSDVVNTELAAEVSKELLGR